MRRVSLASDSKPGWQAVPEPIDPGSADGRPEAPAASFLDAGAGLRLRGLGGNSTLRLDIAWGLTDGASAISVGWEPF